MSKSNKNQLILLSQYIKYSNVISLLKWIKYKNRLTFAYYTLTLWDFKSSKCSKNLTSVKSKKEIFKNMSKYRNTVYYDFKSRFLAIFSSNYHHRLLLKIPFPDHTFSKISKYRTENLHFSSTGKYYALSPPAAPFNPWIEADENCMDMRYGMSTVEQYRKEEIGKENQLQTACIRNKRETTWIQS